MNHSRRNNITNNHLAQELQKPHTIKLLFRCKAIQSLLFIFFLLVVGMFSQNVYAGIQPPNLLWSALSAHSVNSNTVAGSVAIDSENNVVVVGGSDGTIHTVKYDSNGNQLWATNYSHGFNVWPTSFTVDSSDNIYITGTSFLNDSSSSNIVTVKYASNGNKLWEASYGNSVSVNYAVKVSTDSSGNAYVTGNEWSVNTYSCNMVVIKYDITGNQLWAAKYKNEPVAAVTDSTTDGAGNTLLTGIIEDSLIQSRIGLTIKYDTGGNQLWEAAHDGGLSWNHDISVDSAGNTYVTGFNGSGYPFLSTIYAIKYDSNGNQLWLSNHEGGGQTSYVTLDSAGNIYVTATEVNMDFWTMAITIKYDQNGNEIWASSYGHPDTDTLTSAIVTDSSGNIYVVGNSWNTSGFVIVKYASDGKQLWDTDYGPYAASGSLALDNTGNVYVAGSFFTEDGSDYGIVTLKYAPNNTPSGSNVTVPLYNGAIITFTNITSEGDTTAITTAAGPTPPAGFFIGNPPIYYDIRTTATFTSSATVCISYNDQIDDPTAMRLFHYDNNQWVDVTTSNDTSNYVICGETNSLSPFAIFQSQVSPLIKNLMGLLKGYNLKQGISNSLDVKLQKTMDALYASKSGDKSTICNAMNAFNNEVLAQTGKNLTVEQANQLVSNANGIRSAFGCL